MARLIADAADAVGSQNTGVELSETFVREVAKPVRAIVESRYPHLRRDGSVVGILEDDEPWAECCRFDDGSALVLVSQEIIGLCLHLARIAAMFLSPSRGRSGKVSRIRMARALLAENKASDFEMTAAGLLRYHLVHQRFEGLGAKLTPILDGADLAYAESLGLLSVQFVIAHELGHHALAHPQTRRGFVGREQLPATSGDVDYELEADRFAASVLTEHCDGAEQTAWFGCRIAILVIDLVEKALLVRRGRSHPTPQRRLQAIGEPSSSRGRAADGALMGGVLRAVDLNTNLHRALPEQAWDAVETDPRVSRMTKTPEYLHARRELDKIMSADADGLYRLLTGTWPQGRHLVESIDRARELGEVHPLFAEWGVRRDVVEAIAEESRPLAFQSLMQALVDTQMLQAVDGDTTRRVLAACTVALVDLRAT